MQIEDLIKQNKDKLDVEQPPPEVWDKIKKDWKSEPKYSFSYWKVAALVFISTSLVLLFYSLSLQNQVNELASLGDISEEYETIEKGYQEEITQLESAIPINEVSNNEDLSWLLEEMEVLEEINEMYRRDIGTVADQDQLVNALIDYYEKKIKILRKLELEINRTKKFEENEADNTTDISI